MKEWDASIQGYISLAFKIDDTWYGSTEVISGYPYYVNVSTGGNYCLTGEIPSDTSFNLVCPSTGYNTIVVPLSMDITTAAELGANIPNCTAVKEWDASIQGYQSLAFKIGDEWFGSAEVKKGYPYYVNVTAEGTWPNGSR